MPLFYQHNINESTKLAIWKIEEDEDFFLGYVPLSREVTHPHKRLQHLAGRYLLYFLFPNFPLSEIIIASTRKPFLENDIYHFSISHCGDYAAAIVSRNQRVGVDIELVSPKLQKIKHKFLSDSDYSLAARQNHMLVETDMLTTLWSAKEAAFKWYGNGQVDFKKHLVLAGEFVAKNDEWMQIPLTFSKNAPVDLTLFSRRFGELVLCWVMS